MAYTARQEATRRRNEFTLFCENLGGHIAQEENIHSRAPTGKISCVIPLEDVRLKHNKFVPIAEGDLSSVREVSIIDEASFEKEQIPAAYITKKYQFTTTMGNSDPDHANWFAVLERPSLDRNETALVIVQRKRF